VKCALALLAACGGSHAAAPDASSDAALCTTQVTYGDAWIHGANHPSQIDTADGTVTWDGTCTDDGANSFALLSNGWKPYFTGHGCAIALDHACASSACATRITYGATWEHPANHPAQYDDVAGRVFDVGGCALSNGWAPYFTGECELSQRWSDCGGLYTNPVIAHDCPDPGVLHDGDRYVLSCTSGNASDAYPIYVSSDLATWTAQGHILPAAAKPAWTVSDFWAPEIHKVGTHWVAYFSARGSDGVLAIGAASAPDPLGPFTALAQPLVHDANMGLIDASEYNDGDGTPYLLWKEDGNAQGKPTPIHAAQLASDGLSIVGTPATLITNDRSWEGAVVEGPWLIAHDGMYYLFYSGNSYADASYALGVARASSVLGPYAKPSAPIVTSAGAWAGPGHCSVVDGHADDYVVYHAWQAAHVGQAPGRLVLVDQIVWSNGWPAVPGAPSSATRPLP
jgi:arabinan endo-1,5-alpha-L-arabinosidase